MKAAMKLLFDLCFIYALGAFFVMIYAVETVSPIGFAFIALPIIAYCFLRDKYSNLGRGIAPLIRLVIFVFPGLYILIFNPGFAQTIHFVLAWAYISLSMWSDRVDVSKASFLSHFKLTAVLYLSIILVVFAPERFSDALTQMIPFVIVYLMIGFVLLRILREEGKLSSGRNILVLIVVLAAAVIITVAEVPGLLLSGLGFIYHNVIVWILLGFAVAVSKAFSLIMRLFNPAEPNEEEDGYYEMEGDMEAVDYAMFTSDTIPWFVLVIAVILIAIVVFAIIMIIRAMLGDRIPQRAQGGYVETKERLSESEKRAANRFFRPKDPRLAVRWYYRKFLKAGASKGASIGCADTSLSAKNKCDVPFSGHEDQTAELRELYIKARYRHADEPDKAQVEESAGLWKAIKRD